MVPIRVVIVKTLNCLSVIIKTRFEQCFKQVENQCLKHVLQHSDIHRLILSDL